MKNEILKHLYNGSFTSDNFFYVYGNYKNVHLIYATYLYDTTKPYPNQNQKLELAAIFKEGKVYVINPYHFFTEKELKENDTYDDVFVNYFEELHLLNEKAKDYFVDILTNWSFLNKRFEKKEIDKVIWRMLFTQKDEVYDITKIVVNPIITQEEFYDILLNNADYKKIISDYFDDNFERISEDVSKWRIARKNVEKYKEYEEYKIYQALSSLNAKNLTVTFKKNGKSAVGKMPKNDILSSIFDIQYSGSFSTYGKYDFVKDHDWPCLIFGCDLSPKDIVKIMYGKKTVYEKNH